MREVPEPKTGWANRLGAGWTEAISIFAPRLALKQRMARKAYQFSGGYTRGSEARRKWNGFGGSADADNLQTLDDRRQKSRDRWENDPVAKAGIRAFVRDIRTGLKPQPMIDADRAGLSKGRAREAERQAVSLFDSWASSKFADIAQSINFFQSQRVVQAGHKMNGDIAVILRREPHRRRIVPLAFQLIEADRISTPYKQFSNPSIRDGVEKDENGATVAYHVRKAHPGDAGLVARSSQSSQEWIRIPAFNDFSQPNVLLRMEKQRPEQSRGVPTMSSILDYLHSHDQMMEAELMAQLIAASIGVLIKSGNPSAYGRSSAGPDTHANQRLEEIYPAMIEYIGNDEEWDAFNPSRPSDTLKPFMEGIHRLLALGFDLPLPVVFQAWENINYSGARTIVNEANGTFDIERYDLEIDYTDPIYEQVMTLAWLAGMWLPEIDPKAFFANQDAILKADWTGDSRGYVDPLKEITAARMRMRPDQPVSTMARECAAQGMRVEDVIAQQGREKAMREAEGLPPLPAKDIDVAKVLGLSSD